MGRSVTPAAVHVLSLAAGYAGLLALLRDTWFQGDDFEYLAFRVGPDPRTGIWFPHNEHWSTAPILIWRALYDLFGLTSALPYLAVSLAAHVLVAHLLWRLMRRVGVGAWTGTGLAAAFVVLGAGAENITWAFQLGFMGSVALGLLALLLVVRDGRPSFVAAVLVALLSLTFSGLSVVLVGMAVLYLVTVRRRRQAVLLAVACGSTYIAWYILAGRIGARPAHTATLAERLAEVPSWTWRAVTLALEAFFSAPGAGWLLLIGLAIGVARHLRLRAARERPLPVAVGGVLVALVGTLSVQVVSLAVQRADLGAPDTSRYVYVVVALVLPLIGLVLTGPWPRAGRRLAATLVGYLVLTQGIELVAVAQAAGLPGLRADVLGLAVLAESGERLFPTGLASHVDQRSVGIWAARGDLGHLRATPAQAVSDARVLAQVRVTDVRPEDTGPGAVLRAPGEVAPGSCVVTATRPAERAAVLELTSATTVSVMSPDGGQLAYRVVAPGPGSRSVTVPLLRNQTYWITVAAPLTVDVLAVDGQPLELCSA
jgi:spore maturation protein SpmB